MKKKHHLPYSGLGLALSCCLFWASGCTPVLYIPNTVNAPLLERKGDHRGSVGVVGAVSSVHLDVDLQGAYAVSNHIAVMANASLFNDPTEKLKHHLLEAGLGTYTSFWRNKRQINVGRAEFFGGYGKGWAEDVVTDFCLFCTTTEYSYYKGSYNRVFLQPAVGFRTRIIDYSFATRFGFIHFTDYQHFRNEQLMNDGSFSFSTIEPAGTWALGYKWIKFYLQGGYVFPIGGMNSKFNDVIGILFVNNYFNLNAGIAYTPWYEVDPPKPPIALEPTKPAPKDSLPVTPTPESAPEPVVVIPVVKPAVTICLREGGSPDGDVVSVSFDGAFIFQNVELKKKPQCFEAEVTAGQAHVLVVHGISDGKFQPNTVQILVREGKKERVFYVQMKAGETRELKFNLRG